MDVHWALINHHLNGVALSAGLIALFTLAEINWPAASNGGVRGRITNVIIGMIVSIFAFFCTGAIMWLAVMAWRDGVIGIVLPGWRHHGIFGLAISIVAYGIVWDFFQYWFHRWQHRSALLWPSHRVHHTDDAVNTTTALRRSVIELLMIFIFILVPTLIVAGVDEVAAPVAFANFLWMGILQPRQYPFLARSANAGILRAALAPSAPWHRRRLSRPEFRRLFSGSGYRVRNIPDAAKR